MWILLVVAMAGALLWLRPRDDLRPPDHQHRTEEVAVAEPPSPVPVRAEVQLPEQEPVVVQPEPRNSVDAQKSPATPEPTPEWINEASFVEAGLTHEQAAELVEGMRLLQEHKSVLLEQAARNNKDTSALAGLLMLELGPSLAMRIKDGSIAFKWTPRLEPWPQFAGNSFFRDGTPGSLQKLSYSAHGRLGFVSLEIPREVCDSKLWDRVAAAHDAK